MRFPSTWMEEVSGQTCWRKAFTNASPHGGIFKNKLPIKRKLGWLVKGA